MNTHLPGSAHLCTEARFGPLGAIIQGEPDHQGWKQRIMAGGSQLGKGMDSGFWVTTQRR